MKTSPSARRAAKIKADIQCGLKQKEIAAKHGVSRGLVSDITTGRRHKAVPWPDGKVTKKKLSCRHKPIPDSDPTDKRVMDLEAEVSHLTAERNRARLEVKANAKTRGILQAMGEEIKEHLSPFSPPPPLKSIPRGRKVSVEHCVLHLSDMHSDQIVRAEECGGLETFDFPIACCRAEKYVDSVIDWTQHSIGSNFRFPHLWILSYGDHTSGEIHGACERSYFRNQIQNSIAVGRLQYLMIRDLAQHFEHVHVISVPGNHGRRSVKKNHHGAHDNWDYLVAMTAKSYARDHKNVDWHIPNAFSANVDIGGVGFHVAHGDDMRSWAGMPYYSLQKRQRNLAALNHALEGPRLRYFCYGHFHKPASMGDMDAEIIVNGAWLATDAYAYNSFAGYCEPQQLLHGVNAKHGITWRLPMYLRDREAEKRGPKRYDIGF